ncbi:cytidylate kinase [Paraburkholderia sp. WC7.3d]
MQERLDLPRQFERARRRRHALRRAHEQRVAERLAQAFERAADGRLRNKQPLRGTRDAALFQQRAEAQQQVQVEAPKIIFNDIGHDIKRFE